MKTASFSQAELNGRILTALNDHVWGTVGKESVETARALAALLGREAALFCSSHAGAAETVLRALEVSFGDEVILPAFCSPFLKEAVEAVGAKCVFCEVDDTLLLNPHSLSFCRTERTQAVFCENTAGYVADLKAIRAFTEEYDLPLILVSADPYCERVEDKSVAQYADILLCAFPLQNLSALVTDEEFIGKLYAAHHCGNPYGHPGGLNTGVCLGGDMRVDEFRCALIDTVYLSRADEVRRQKNSLRIRLTEALLQSGALLFDAHRGTDPSGDYLLCRVGGKEPCRDKATSLPQKAYTRDAELTFCGVVVYSVL